MTAVKAISWKIELNELSGITLASVVMVGRLPNGNTSLPNFHAGLNHSHFFEMTPVKNVVWTFKDFKNSGDAMPVGRTLSEVR